MSLSLCSRSVLALCLGLSSTALGCASLTEPGNGAPPPAPAAAATAEPTPAPAPAPAPAAPAEEERVAASHVLVQYKGSLRASPDNKRSKEAAKKLAADISAKAKRGQDFGGLVKQYSDEPGAKERAGALGKFSRNMMVKPFSDAAFALQPGQVSDVVETDFGFHVIKRTE